MAGSGKARQPARVSMPLALTGTTIRSEWVNALGHLRAAEYICLFDEATTALLVGQDLVDAELRDAETSPVLVDLHVCYLREVAAGSRIAIAAQVLGVDAKRVRALLTMRLEPGGDRAATCELLIVNMDLATRRTTAWSRRQAAIWQRLVEAHAGLAVPVEAGRGITLAAQPAGAKAPPVAAPAKNVSRRRSP